MLNSMSKELSFLIFRESNYLNSWIFRTLITVLNCEWLGAYLLGTGQVARWTKSRHVGLRIMSRH